MRTFILAVLFASAVLSWSATEYNFFKTKPHDQIRAEYLGLNTEFDKDTMLSMFFESTVTYSDTPENFDWREQSPACVHPVRDQGKCGSCWAHGASEAFSDRVCIQSQGSINKVFSPQQLVNCDYLDHACNGGFLTTPFIYYALVGAQEESCYGEYNSGNTGDRTEVCFIKKWNCPVTKASINTIRWLTTPQAIKEELYKNGPINTGFKVYKDFLNYKSGIYTQTTDELLGGHAVKIVGWGKEGDQEYWIVQNSWSTSWGEEGYFRIAFGQCGIDKNGVSINPSL